MPTAMQKQTEERAQPEGRKLAWIDHENRIVSFYRTEQAVCYCDEPERYWRTVKALVARGFRVQ